MNEKSEQGKEWRRKVNEEKKKKEKSEQSNGRK